jgi:hypothetical protein
VAHKTHWIGPAFGYAMQAFGVAAISNVAVTYSLEMYNPVREVNSQLFFYKTADHEVGYGRGARENFRHQKYYRHTSIPIRNGLD